MEHTGMYQQDFRKYKAQELDNDKKLNSYDENYRANWTNISGIQNLLHRGSSKYLYAINPFSRIQVMRHTLDVFEEEIGDEIKKTYLATFVPERFAFPLDEAQNFNPHKLKRLIRASMKGQDYFGAIEASIYPNHEHRSSMTKGLVHFHAHLLVWDSSHKDLKLVEETVARKNKSFIWREEAFHFEKAREADVGNILGYIMKSPANQYGLEYDPDNPEFASGLTRKYRQTKTEIRSGNAAKLALIMQDMYIDKLLVAGGEGVSMKREIIKRSLSRYHHEEAMKKLRRTG
ncbi:MAG: hypothetical protein N4A65_09300 [Cohaesibacter sp.]|jgi:hypothetical protein|nr:hypothetical protein [Cohaesibacter sp.]